MARLLNRLGANASDQRFNALLLAAYAVTLIIGLAHHEMWRDELQIWLIGRDSHTLTDFFANRRYESNPILWYRCVFLVAKISTHPAILQLFQFLAAMSCAFLFVRFAPFGRLHKVLFVSGYFMIYEYGIIARGYVSGMFLFFLFAVLFSSRQRNYIALCLVLFLLANTSAFGWIAAFALAVMLATEYFENRGSSEMTPEIRSHFNMSMLALAAGMAYLLYFMIPPKDSTLALTWYNDWKPGRIYSTLHFLAAAFFPAPDFTAVQFWNTSLILSLKNSLADLLFAGYGLVVAGWCVMLFNRKRGILAFFLAATAGFLAFALLNRDVQFKLAPRHYGHIYLAFITALWILESYRAKLPPFGWISRMAERMGIQRYSGKILTALLFFQVAGGICAFVIDIRHPFSGAKKAAEYLKEKGLDRLPILATVDFAVSPLSAYLERPLYYPEIDTQGTFIVWNLERIRFTDRQFTANVHNYILAHDTPVVLVFNYRPQVLAKSDIEFALLDSTGPAVVADEALHIYLARKKDVLKLLNDSLAYLGDSAVAEHFKEIAIRQYEEGDWQKAGVMLEKIRDANPDVRLYGLHAYLGRIYLRKGQPEAAHNAFLREAELGLMKDEAFFQLGVMAFEKRDTFTAMQHWEKTVAENPGHVNAHNNLGVCFVMLGKHREAEALWLKAVQLNPDYVEGYFNLVRLFYTLRNNSPGGEYDRKFLEYVRLANSRGVTPEMMRSKGIQVPDEAVK